LSSPAPLRLRPLEVGDLLDETFRIYRRHFLLFAGISVILSIPAAGLSGYTFFALFNSLAQSASAGGPPDLNAFFSSLAVVGIGYLVNFLLSPFTTATVIYAACASAQGRPVTIWGALGGVLRRYFAILGYVLLLDLMVLFFCLFPLWTWIAVGWVAVLPVMFVERAGLIAAMGRSWLLVQGRWWRTFLIVFLIGLLWYLTGAALAAFVSLASQLVGILVSSYVVLAVLQSAAVIIQALATPVFQIAIVLIYFDLRVRREALDLFQLAERVAASQPA
jgi:hypothetical protein